jgi:hypothetical protein
MTRARGPPPGRAANHHQHHQEEGYGMPQMTVKELGDAIRKNLKQAQAAGNLPRELRFRVRATRAKGRPNVNVTIEGVESLIPEPREENIDAWMAVNGRDLKEWVERIRNAYNPDPPVYGGQTEYGPIFLSATVTGVTRVEL